MNYRDYNPNQSCLPPSAYLRLTGAVKKPESPIIGPSWLRFILRLFLLLALTGCKEKPPNDLIYRPQDEPSKKITIVI